VHLRVQDRVSAVEIRSDVLTFLASRQETVRRLLYLIGLYAIPAIAIMTPIIDPDIWWHLRTGQWIVEHGAVPTTDPFSSYGMGKPWIAYSWLFEVLVYGLYSALGLTGILLYRVILSFAVVAAVHRLVAKREPRFIVATNIVLLAVLGILPVLNVRPWLFTILFFTLTLDAVLDLREGTNTKAVWLLPLMYALWANLHIQFIYGLFVLSLATAESMIEGLFRRAAVENDERTIPSGRLLIVTTSCAVATLATPYHLHVYRTILEYITQTGHFEYILELLALSFRSPWDWFVLAATLGAAFSLGWQREVRPFPLLLLAAGAFLSFRARRDIWFVVIAAAALIATFRSPKAVADRFALTKRRVFLVTAVVVAVLVIVGRVRNISERHLESALAEKYPVAAAAVVEERAYPGPLYNHFNWGGYLIWRLPNLPVAMDGRSNLHGEERTKRSLKTWAGIRTWVSDPELAAARLVIAQAEYPLASLLRLDPRFELVYEDDIAAIFVARPHPEGQHARNHMRPKRGQEHARVNTGSSNRK